MLIMFLCFFPSLFISNIWSVCEWKLERKRQNPPGVIVSNVNGRRRQKSMENRLTKTKLSHTVQGSHISPHPKWFPSAHPLPITALHDPRWREFFPILRCKRESNKNFKWLKKKRMCGRVWGFPLTSTSLSLTRMTFCCVWKKAELLVIEVYRSGKNVWHWNKSTRSEDRVQEREPRRSHFFSLPFDFHVCLFLPQQTINFTL